MNIMNLNNKIKGFIFDIDGTLITEGKAIQNAPEAIRDLRQKGYQLRFITNMTGNSPYVLSEMLNALGFDILPEEISTSVTTAITYLKSKKFDQGGFFAIPKKLESQFIEFKENTINPDFVVLGDLEEEMTYELLNKIFNFLRNGAELITFHKNMFFVRNSEFFLDTGMYIKTFESILGMEVLVMGKPSPEIFKNAVNSMNLNINSVAIVGDDLCTDIEGAKNIGAISILVGTGKFQSGLNTTSAIQADFFIDNVGLLPEMM